MSEFTPHDNEKFIEHVELMQSIEYLAEAIIDNHGYDDESTPSEKIADWNHPDNSSSIRLTQAQHLGDAVYYLSTYEPIGGIRMESYRISYLDQQPVYTNEQGREIKDDDIASRVDPTQRVFSLLQSADIEPTKVIDRKKLHKAFWEVAMAYALSDPVIEQQIDRAMKARQRHQKPDFENIIAALLSEESQLKTYESDYNHTLFMKMLPQYEQSVELQKIYTKIISRGVGIVDPGYIEDAINEYTESDYYQKHYHSGDDSGN
ncbi:hypothetical protein EON76_04680 [bacterium]|nr:MAG: hypothetical protein EON76_04680 [bacterium]